MKEKLQFKVGDYIFYYGTGVCKVEAIDVLESPKDHLPKTYYRLLPIFDGGNIISPIERAHKNGRQIISSPVAKDLLGQLQQIEQLAIASDKESEKEYKAILQEMECYKAAQLFKTLYLRKKVRNQEKKTFRQVDEKYLRLTQKLVSGELAASLHSDPEQICAYMETELNR